MKKIINNDLLKCSCGSAPSNFCVSSQNIYYANNQLIATEKDNEPNKNILPFGACTVLRSSCTPQKSVWQNISKLSTIEGNAVLLDNSFLLCPVGGKIELLSTKNDIISES